MPAEHIALVNTDLDSINQFIKDKLAPAIDDTPLELVNATFLSILIDRQGPSDLTIEELQEGVKLASGTIATYVSMLRDTSRPS